MIRIDTNYIIRYLMNDNIKMADIAEEILTTKDVFIANEILAEVVYVLFGVYKISKKDIANQLLELIKYDNIVVSDYSVINKALNIFKNKNLDFVDCILCAYAKQDEIIPNPKEYKTAKIKTFGII